MKLEQAKDRFIQAWGALGSSWGINRTMSQIHALLLVSDAPMSADEVMAQLKISRGNANMNTRSLIDWGLVKKEFVPGDRKEYFVAHKEVDYIARQIAQERRKRELQPIIDIMNEVKQVGGNSAEVQAFKKTMTDISEFTAMMDKLSDKFVRSDRGWFVKLLMRAIKKAPFFDH